MMNYKVWGIVAVLGIFLVLALGGSVVESVDADEIMVVQSLTSGQLTWYTTPGVKPQWFGKVTKYRKMTDLELNSKVMFNDNGTGVIMGRFQVELPLTPEQLTALHSKYGSQIAIEQSLVKPTIDKVIYMTGPLMSSKESSAERKTDLIRYIVDQIDHGVYRTAQREQRVEDEFTKEVRTRTVAEVVLKEGVPDRQEDSVLNEFGIRIVNFAPNAIDYDDQVEKQIKRQQEITMQVQTARAQAIEAEQRSITAEAEGKAQVMQAKYAREVDKIQAVTRAQQEYEVQKRRAEQEFEVARLAAQSAEQTKRKEILLGEGESTRKRLVLAADGALQQKLETWLSAQQAYASAIGKYQGQWVPLYMSGGSGGPQQNGATALMELLTAKTAKDLALDLSVKGHR